MTVIIFVKESQHIKKHTQPLLSSIALLPAQFKLFLITVGIFGFGNFAPSLLILRSTQLLSANHNTLTASGLSILFYTLYNITYAACSLPIGYLADTVGKKPVLITGYLLTGIAISGFIYPSHSPLTLALLFMLMGLAIASSYATEKSICADMLPANLHGTGFGALAMVHGFGNFGSSIMVGLLWTNISAFAGFGYSALLCILGGLVLWYYIRTN